VLNIFYKDSENITDSNNRVWDYYTASTDSHSGTYAMLINVSDVGPNNQSFIGAPTVNIGSQINYVNLTGYLKALKGDGRILLIEYDELNKSHAHILLRIQNNNISIRDTTKFDFYQDYDGEWHYFEIGYWKNATWRDYAVEKIRIMFEGNLNGTRTQFLLDDIYIQF